MARQINDILELEQENEQLKEALYLLKQGMQRLKLEYFTDSLSLSETAIEEVDEDLNSLISIIETTLY